MDSDTAFDVLGQGRRRRLLRELFDRGGHVTLDTLIPVLVDQFDDLDERSVKIQLYHVDLPKLAEADILEYDRRTGEITLCDGAVTMQAFLDATRDEVPPETISP